MTVDTTTTPDPSADNPHFGVNDLEATPDKAFREYPIDERVVDALEANGITHPFPIQTLTLPMALQGHDIIGQARTGTGKTLAFGLPLLERCDPSLARTQALVVCPTRELAIQVAKDLTIGAAKGLTQQTVYGGVGYEEQTESLEAGVHVVVGTPGRLLDMLNRGILDLSQVRTVVLDEADEMLDMGFLPDVERILEAAGTDVEERHTMLFSATMPASIVKLGRRYMHKPTFMRADTEEHETAPTVEQHFFQVFRMDKPRVLARILQTPDRGNVYVFCRTKAMVDRLVRELDDLGVASIAVHGDIRQASREKNLDKFRDGSIDVLVATEVAARGLDVDNVSHVVNYDCPDDEKMYLHRIGRTARAGRKGVAVTFAEHAEIARASMIRKAVELEGDVEEIFSTSDRLSELFDLPDTTPWEHLGRSGKGGGRSKSSSKGSGGGSSRGSSKGSSSKASSSRSGGSSSRGPSKDSGGGSSSRGSSKGSGGGSSSRGSSKGSGDGSSSRGSSKGSGDGSQDRSRRSGAKDSGSSDAEARSGSSRRSGDDDRGRSNEQDGPDRGRNRSASRERDDTAAPTDRDDQKATKDREATSSSSDDRDRERNEGGGTDVDAMVAERARARAERRSKRDGGSGDSSGSSSSGRRNRADEGSDASSDDGPKGGARPRSARKRASATPVREMIEDDDGGGDDQRRDRRGRRGAESRDGGGDSGSDRNSGRRSSSSKDRGGKGRDSKGRSGNRNSSKGRSGGSSDRSSGSSNRSGGGDGGAATPGVVTTRSGAEARGEGRPRLERRVEVEHLP